MDKEKRKHIVPNWFYYILLFVGLGGGVQIYSGTYAWGITLEQNTFMVMIFLSLFIIIVDSTILTIKKYKNI